MDFEDWLEGFNVPGGLSPFVLSYADTVYTPIVQQALHSREEHLVPNVAGVDVILEAGTSYGIIGYRKHPKLNAFYVKAIT